MTDECSRELVLFQVKTLKEENKQLKELNKLNLEHWKELGHEKYLLKQKLEKIEGFLDNLNDAYTDEGLYHTNDMHRDSIDSIRFRLKEILESRND